jgi:TRAP-type C4-dicarboxylate transport system permease small subunit
MSRKNGIREIYNRFEDFISIVIPSILCVILCLSITTEIVSRFVFNYSITGVVDVVEQSVFLITFLSLAGIQTARAHITMDILPEKLKGRKSGYVLDIFLLIGTLLLIAVMAAELIWFLKRSIQTGICTSTLVIPIQPFVIVGIFGLLMVCIRLVIQIKDSYEALKQPNNSVGMEG